MARTWKRGRQLKAEPISFTSTPYARKELRETTYWLRLLKASRLVGHDACEALEDEATQLLRILTTIIRKSQAKND